MHKLQAWILNMWSITAAESFQTQRGAEAGSPSWYETCRLPGNSTFTIAGRLAAVGPSLCSFSAACQTDWSPSTQPPGTHWPLEGWWKEISYRSLYKQAWVNIYRPLLRFYRSYGVMHGGTFRGSDWFEIGYSTETLDIHISGFFWKSNILEMLGLCTSQLLYSTNAIFS